MASRFWVGGTGTWSAAGSSTGNHWATSSNGAGADANAPVAGDNVTFDANSGGGTVTPDGTIAGIAFGDITAGAFALGTLAFNTNNPSVSFATVSFSGSATRTINMGSGTWTITGGGGSTPFDCGTTTGLTPTFQNAAISITGASTSRVLGLGAPTGGYGAITIGNNSTKGVVSISGGPTVASLTVGSGNTIANTQSTTLTITGALSITGTSSAPSGLQSLNSQANITTVSVGSASTCDWCSFLRVTKSGAGSISATNSFDLGGNTSITITAPSVGGGVVGVIGG